MRLLAINCHVYVQRLSDCIHCILRSASWQTFDHLKPSSSEKRMMICRAICVFFICVILTQTEGKKTHTRYTLFVKKKNFMIRKLPGWSYSSCIPRVLQLNNCCNYLFLSLIFYCPISSFSLNCFSVLCYIYYYLVHLKICCNLILIFLFYLFS